MRNFLFLRGRALGQSLFGRKKPRNPFVSKLRLEPLEDRRLLSVFYSENLDADPGWMISGEWAFGTPAGLGGAPSGTFGNPDPMSGATGANVYGVNLNGDYNLAPGGPWYLTTNPIDCTPWHNVVLDFQRWLNTDAATYVPATVDVSNDGANWTNIYTSSISETDNAWMGMAFSINSVADNQPTVYIRWGYQVNPGANSYSGWNIDDVKLNGDPDATDDFGDAPTAVQSGFASSYPTFQANNGASHQPSGLMLGATWDAEADGQPTLGADGDDLNSAPDEDGVLFMSPLVGGAMASVQVNCSGSGFIDAWLDYNSDGDWADTGEQIFNSFPVTPGMNILNFSVASTPTDKTYARFRLSGAGGLSPGGAATDGEVEDYAFGTISGTKWNDSNMNTLWDPTESGLSNWTIYVDWNFNGSFDPGEPSAVTDALGNYLITGLPAGLYRVAEVQQQPFWWQTFPPSPGTYNVNFGPGLPVSITGLNFGNFQEEEMYDLDFGDAPTASQSGFASNYPTLIAHGAACHYATGPMLGTNRDAETDGQPTVGADGDDLNIRVARRLFAVPTDYLGDIVELNPADGSELNRFPAPVMPSYNNDGLAFDGSSLFYMTNTTTLYELNPNTGAVLDSDLITAGSGSFDGLGAVGGSIYILDIGSNNILVFDPITDAVTGTITVPGVTLSGGLSGITNPNALIATVNNGTSVVEIDPATSTVTNTFAPTTGTPINGTAVVNGEIYLGQFTIGDIDVYDRSGVWQRTVSSLPYNFSALGGDDFNVRNDEDGVIFNTPLVSGALANIQVTASGAGLLDAWIDYNSDGDWTDPGEQIFISTAVGTGANILSFPVLMTPQTKTYARFRLSTAGGLSPGGMAYDGEVEDYAFGTVSGNKWLDVDADSTWDGGEPAVPNWVMYVDWNWNGMFDPLEPSAVTDGAGNYTITGLPPGPCAVAEVLQPGWTQTYPVGIQPTASVGGTIPSLATYSLIPSSPWAVQTLVNNGSSTNRLDLVFVGDGYTSPQLGTYNAQILNILTAFAAGYTPSDPFLAEYYPFYNVHEVDVISPQSGVDHDPTYPTWVNTALDMGFWYMGIQRLLGIDVTKAKTAAGCAPDVDQIMALANSTSYGGAGYITDDIATVSAGDPNAIEIALHEYGHSFGNLADEYWTPGTTYTGPEPTEANVSTYNSTTMAAMAAKWYLWLGSPSYVGTYTGGYNFANGIFRPTPNSKMQTLGQPYDVVNSEQMIVNTYKSVRPIDSATENGCYTVGKTFYVDPVDPATKALNIQWYINGAIIPGATGTTLNTSTLGLLPGINRLSVTVVDNTSMVRDPALRSQWMTEQRTWTLYTPLAGTHTVVFGVGLPVEPNNLDFGNSTAVDLGDAPTAAQSGFVANYPTQLADVGALHATIGPTLGINPDAETDGQPTANADGDDTAGAPSDEDGVTFVNWTLFASSAASNASAIVQINLQNASPLANLLDAWIDFNRDGDWNDSGEQIFTGFNLGNMNGWQSLPFTIPQDTGSNVQFGDTYARFRVSTAGGLAPTGLALDGEVEDYKLTIRDTTCVWDGGGADSNWLTPNNWDDNLQPMPGATLEFPAGYGATINNNFPTGTVFDEIVLNGSGYTLQGNAVQLTVGLTDNATSGTNTVAILLGGSGGVTKTGGGTLTLTAANTYTGATLVTGGTLNTANIGSASSPTSSVTVRNSSSLTATSITTGTLTIGGSRSGGSERQATPPASTPDADIAGSDEPVVAAMDPPREDHPSVVAKLDLTPNYQSSAVAKMELASAAKPVLPSRSSEVHEILFAEGEERDLPAFAPEKSWEAPPVERTETSASVPRNDAQLKVDLENVALDLSAIQIASAIRLADRPTQPIIPTGPGTAGVEKEVEALSKTPESIPVSAVAAARQAIFKRTIREPVQPWQAWWTAEQPQKKKSSDSASELAQPEVDYFVTLEKSR